MPVISLSMWQEPKNFDEALKQRKEEAAMRAHCREQYKIEHQRGYENLTNLRGAYRRKRDGL